MKNIALVRLSALGDIINTAFVLQFLKRHNPELSITWVCEEVFAPLLQNHPLIDTTLTVNLKQLKKERSFSLLQQTLQKLRQTPEFDKIIDSQGLLKSAIVARLLGKNTHGFDKDSIREKVATFFYATTTSIPYEANVILRNAKVVADALGFEITKEMIEHKEAVFPFTQKKSTPYIAFVIGASWESKKYPKELMVEVIKQLQEQECYIIWGSEAEKEEALYIQEHSHAKAAPKMSLTELVDFISNAALVIGNDTGPTHLAWAQNVPSITLFGPTYERMIFPTSINRYINSPSKVDIAKIDKNDYSIKEIPPQKVVTLAKELLNGI